MSGRSPIARGGAGRSSGGKGSQAALLIEALVILLFLVASLGLLMQVLSRASAQGERAAELARAVELASNVAERFAVDPAGTAGVTYEDGLSATCEVVSGADGLVRAHIVVNAADDGAAVYELDTARYVSADAALAAGSGSGSVSAEGGDA